MRAGRYALVASDHRLPVPRTSCIRCSWRPRCQSSGTLLRASRRQDVNRRPRRGRSPGGADNSDGSGDDGPDDPAAGNGPKRADVYGAYGYTEDNPDNEVAALAAERRQQQLMAARRARAAAIAGSAAEASARRARVATYLSSRGLGSISYFQDMAENQFEDALVDLKEADIAALEARIAAEGGDLEADWAAVESGRSTTGLAKATAAGGQARGAPLPADALLAPPSNPQIERMRERAQRMRRKRRLFAQAEEEDDDDDDDDGDQTADGSLYADLYSSSSGSDDEGPVGYSYSAGAPLAAPPARLGAVPPRPANPFLRLPRRPEDLPENYFRTETDVDKVLDRLLDRDDVPLGVAKGADDDERYDDDGYDEYGTRRPGFAAGGSDDDNPEGEYGNRVLKALRGTLLQESAAQEEALAVRPERPGGRLAGPGGASGPRKPQKRTPGAPAAPAGADDDDAYAELMELLDVLGGGDIDGGDGDGSLRDVMEAESRSAAANAAPARPPSAGAAPTANKRPVTTTSLLRDSEEGTEARPQLAGRPTSGAGRGGNGGAPAAVRPKGAARGDSGSIRSGWVADSDAAFLEELLEGELSELPESTPTSSRKSEQYQEGWRQQQRQLLADLDLDLDLDSGDSDYDVAGGKGNLASLLLAPTPPPDLEPQDPRQPSLDAKPRPRSRASALPPTPAKPPTSSARGSAAEGKTATRGSASAPAAQAQARRDLDDLLQDDWDELDELSFDKDDSGVDLHELLAAAGRGAGGSGGDRGAASEDVQPQLLARPTKTELLPVRPTTQSGAGARGRAKAASRPAEAAAAAGFTVGDIDSMLSGLSSEDDDTMDYYPDDEEAFLGVAVAALDTKPSSRGQPQPVLQKPHRGPASGTATPAASTSSPAAGASGRPSQLGPTPQQPTVSDSTLTDAVSLLKDPSKAAVLARLEGKAQLAAPPSPRRQHSKQAEPAAPVALAASTTAAPASKTVSQPPTPQQPTVSDSALTDAVSLLKDPSKAAALARLEGKAQLAAPPSPRRQQQSATPPRTPVKTGAAEAPAADAKRPPQQQQQQRRQPAASNITPVQSENATALATPSPDAQGAPAATATSLPLQQELATPAPPRPAKSAAEVALAAEAAASTLRQLSSGRSAAGSSGSGGDAGRATGPAARPAAPLPSATAAASAGAQTRPRRQAPGPPRAAAGAAAAGGLTRERRAQAAVAPGSLPVPMPAYPGLDTGVEAGEVADPSRRRRSIAAREPPLGRVLRALQAAADAAGSVTAGAAAGDAASALEVSDDVVGVWKPKNRPPARTQAVVRAWRPGRAPAVRLPAEPAGSAAAGAAGVQAPLEAAVAGDPDIGGQGQGPGDSPAAVPSTRTGGPVVLALDLQRGTAPLWAGPAATEAVEVRRDAHAPRSGRRTVQRRSKAEVAAEPGSARGLSHLPRTAAAAAAADLVSPPSPSSWGRERSFSPRRGAAPSDGVPRGGLARSGPTEEPLRLHQQPQRPLADPMCPTAAATSSAVDTLTAAPCSPAAADATLDARSERTRARPAPAPATVAATSTGGAAAVSAPQLGSKAGPQSGLGPRPVLAPATVSNGRDSRGPASSSRDRLGAPELRRKIKRGELVSGRVVSFDPVTLTAHVAFPALERCDVPQPVALPAERLLPRLAWGLQRPAEQPVTPPGGNAAPRPGGAVKEKAEEEEVGAGRRGRIADSTMWAAITALTFVDGGAGGAEAEEEPTLSVEVTEVVAPSAKRWLGLDFETVAKMVQQCRYQPLFARVISITDRGAYCLVTMSPPPSTAPTATEAAGGAHHTATAAHSGSGRAATTEARGPAATAVRGTAAKGAAAAVPAAKSAMGAPRHLLCFLPQEMMHFSMADVWAESVARNKAERRERVACSVQAFIPSHPDDTPIATAFLPSSPTPASQPDTLTEDAFLKGHVRLRDMVEARIYCCCSSWVSPDSTRGSVTPMPLVRLMQEFHLWDPVARWADRED